MRWGEGFFGVQRTRPLVGERRPELVDDLEASLGGLERLVDCPLHGVEARLRELLDRCDLGRERTRAAIRRHSHRSTVEPPLHLSKRCKELRAVGLALRKVLRPPGRRDLRLQRSGHVATDPRYRVGQVGRAGSGEESAVRVDGHRPDPAAPGELAAGRNLPRPWRRSKRLLRGAGSPNGRPPSRRAASTSRPVRLGATRRTCCASSRPSATATRRRSAPPTCRSGSAPTAT